MTKEELESKATYIEDPILKPYRIKMDEYQYCLQKYVGGKKSDNYRWSSIGYFNTIEPHEHMFPRKISGIIP